MIERVQGTPVGGVPKRGRSERVGRAMSTPIPSPHSCALRALTLCDGRRLETPDHALGGCFCFAAAVVEAHGFTRAADSLRAARDKLINETTPR